MTITCELTLYKIPGIKYVSAGVVGNLEEMGCWNLNRVLRARTSSGGLHHVRVNLPEETRLEYKWVLFDGVTTWMWEPGPNKIVDLPRFGSCFIMNQWDGPAVVDTQVPQQPSNRRPQARPETEWKVGTPGTVYKNPEHIQQVTPTGDVTMFSGSKIPFGENFILDKPVPENEPKEIPSIETGKVKQLVDKYDLSAAGSKGITACGTCNNPNANESDCCGSNTKGKDCLDIPVVAWHCSSDNSIQQTSSHSSNTDTTTTNEEPSFYNRLSNVFTEFTTDPVYITIATVTGVSCLALYGIFHMTKH